MGLPGGMEWIIIIVLVLVVFGGKNIIPSLKKAGKEAYKVKKEVDEIKNITKLK